jgi:hypothetical protein
VQTRNTKSPARERLRKWYRPARVRILFVGEAPPASGRFFYQADSGLYRAIRDAFVEAYPNMGEGDFLQAFQDLGCYLVDLCGKPVDRMGRAHRKRVCLEGEVRLARILRELRPEIIVTVVRSIAGNVSRSERRANWRGRQIDLPYPGRWQRHRAVFLKTLTSLLREDRGQ